MRTMIIISGGFHHSPSTAIYLDIPERVLINYVAGYTTVDITAEELIEEFASEEQKKRLERHFCGIKGCMCHSWPRRVDIDDSEIIKNAEKVIEVYSSHQKNNKNE